MNRRQFLKALGVGAIAVAAEPITSLISKLNTFDPDNSYGDYVRLTSTEPELLKAVAKLFEKQIKFIPKKYRKNITYRLVEPDCRPNDPLCQYGTAGWKYSPARKVSA